MTIQTAYFPMQGGWNLSTPPLATQAGELIDVQNYEALPTGGYRRIDGYVAFDGSEAPTEIPGVGPVLGVHVYKDVVYGVRSDGAVARMYKSSASGWVEVDNSRVWALGGAFRFTNYNFYGQDDQIEMFIVNGVDPAVKFDGSTFEPISTGLAQDNPSHVAGYAKHLVLAVQSSLMISTLGEPTDFVLDPTEIAVGDTISNLGVGTESLVVGCEDSTHVLYGTSNVDFRFQVLNQSGSYPDTFGSIGGSIVGMGRFGAMSLTASQQFGNFAFNAISAKIDDFAKGYPVTSQAIVNQTKSQYRVFNGFQGLYFTFTGQQMIGVTRVQFLHDVTCLGDGYNDDGDYSFFGSSNGFVYQMDQSNFFDGEPIVAYLTTSFHSYQGPTRNKRFRKLVPDIRVAGSETQLSFRCTTNYGNGYVSSTRTEEILRTGGALWDASAWDNFYWDSQYHTSAGLRLSIIGTNMAVTVSHDGAQDSSHSVYGAVIHYSTRRLER